jgi:hypothetical protein
MPAVTDASVAVDRKLVEVQVARPAEVGEVLVGEDPSSADLPHRLASKRAGSSEPDWPIEDVGRVSVPKGFKGTVVDAGGAWWVID